MCVIRERDKARKTSLLFIRKSRALDNNYSWPGCFDEREHRFRIEKNYFSSLRHVNKANQLLHCLFQLHRAQSNRSIQS